MTSPGIRAAASDARKAIHLLLYGIAKQMGDKCEVGGACIWLDRAGDARQRLDAL